MVSNYIDGKNLGREITMSGNALLYSLTARSGGGRNRVIELVYGGDYDFALWVLSRKELTPEQSAILEYPCIIKVKDREPDTFVIGNGVQTIDIAEALKKPGYVSHPHNFLNKLEQALEINGVEPDEPNYTPRIAGILQKYDDKMSRGFEHAYLGIIYRDDEAGEQRDDDLPPGKVVMHDIKPHLFEFQGIATYTADNPECTSSHGEIRKFRAPPFEDNLYGAIAPAQALAEWRYGQLQEYYVVEEELGLVDTRVATAAIVLKKPAGISIGIKNRHQVRV